MFQPQTSKIMSNFISGVSVKIHAVGTPKKCISKALLRSRLNMWDTQRFDENNLVDTIFGCTCDLESMDLTVEIV